MSDTMSMPVPSIGRIAHYVSLGSARGEFPSTCRAAIMTEISQDGMVGLAVFNPTGVFLHSLENGGCAHDEDKSPGTWHWPERV